jgi:hypothetical protein
MPFTVLFQSHFFFTLTGLPFIHGVHQREERRKSSGESKQDHPEQYVLLMEKCSERQSYEGHG